MEQSTPPPEDRPSSRPRPSSFVGIVTVLVLVFGGFGVIRLSIHLMAFPRPPPADDREGFFHRVGLQVQAAARKFRGDRHRWPARYSELSAAGIEVTVLDPWGGQYVLVPGEAAGGPRSGTGGNGAAGSAPRNASSARASEAPASASGAIVPPEHAWLGCTGNPNAREPLW